jgi:anaerobic dimethyl sulfoxide reductase subunit A
MGISGTYGGSADVGSQAYLPAPFTSMKRAKTPFPRLSMVYTRGWEPGIVYRDDVTSGKMSEEKYRQITGQAADWPLLNIGFVEIKLGAYHGNHQQNLVYQAFRKADFVVAPMINMRHPHPGAHILLPLSDYMDGLWRSFNSGDRRRGNYANAGFKFIKKLGERQDVEWVNIQLSKRFDIADKFSPLLLDKLDSEDAWDKANDDIMKAGYDTWIKSDTIKPMNPPTWEEFKKSPVFYAPHPGPLHISWVEKIQKGQPFETESGKIEFYNKFIASGDVSKKSFVLPKRGDQRMCFGGDATPKMPPIAQWIPPINQYFGRDGAKYPLQVLTGGPRVYRTHHAQDFNLWALEEYRHAVWLSVPDAKARGIKDGDTVRIYNDNGEIVAPAYVTSRILPGITHISFGAYPQFSSVKSKLSPEGVDTRGASNLLTRSDTEGWVLGPVHCADVAEVEKF